MDRFFIMAVGYCMAIAAAGLNAHSRDATPAIVHYDFLPDGFIWFQGLAQNSFYGVSRVKAGWQLANQGSGNDGIHLATIQSQEENRHISKAVKSLAAKSGIRPWIGLRYTSDFSGFELRWSTGESPTYTNWAPGEPDDPMTINQFYIALNPETGEWTNESDSNRFYIVETEVDRFPAPTPTPARPPDLYHELGGEDAASNRIAAGAPSGYAEGKTSFGPLAAGPGPGAKGMTIGLPPGSGVFAVYDQPVEAGSLMKISCRLRASGREATVALVALNYPVDGQFGYIALSGGAVPAEEYREVELFYQPPSGRLLVAVQAVNSPFASLSSTVWVDHFAGHATEWLTLNQAALETDGSFNLEDEYFLLNTNINGDTGETGMVYQTVLDNALRLSIKPDGASANAATTAYGLTPDDFPLRLLGRAGFARDLPSEGGMASLTVTNGFQSAGVFRSVGQLPSSSGPAPEWLIAGGVFEPYNPKVPVTCIVQIGGTGVASSIVVDDLTLSYE